MKVSIIPEPQKLFCGEKMVFTLTKLCEFEYSKELENEGTLLSDFCSEIFEIDFVGTGKESISLSLDSAKKTKRVIAFL